MASHQSSRDDQNVTATDSPKPLTSFFAFLKDFKSVSGWAGKIGIPASFADVFIGVGPPWPARSATAIACVFAQLIVLMGVFELYGDNKKPRWLPSSVLFVSSIALLII